MPDEISKSCILKKMSKDTLSVLASIPGACIYVLILLVKRSIGTAIEIIYLIPSIVRFFMRGLFHPFKNPDDATVTYQLLAVSFLLVAVLLSGGHLAIIPLIFVLVCVLIAWGIHPFIKWYEASYTYCLEHKEEKI